MNKSAVNCPSDDYDFYIIPLPLKNVLHKKRNNYISTQLEKLHPCFSDDCSFDSHLRLEKRQLQAEVVVMQKYKVAEYKSQNKRLFVKERKHIQFFSSTKKRSIIHVVTAVVCFVILLTLAAVLNQSKRSHSLAVEHNTTYDTQKISTVPQKLSAPDFLQLINTLNGYISDFEWTYDGYNETLCASVHGLFPEQLESFEPVLKLSTVNFENSIPNFTASYTTKINLPAFELQNVNDYRNDFRQTVMQNEIVIIQETVNPFGLRLSVPKYQLQSVTVVFSISSGTRNKFE